MNLVPETKKQPDYPGFQCAHLRHGAFDLSTLLRGRPPRLAIWPKVAIRTRMALRIVWQAHIVPIADRRRQERISMHIPVGYERVVGYNVHTQTRQERHGKRCSQAHHRPQAEGPL